MKKRKGLGASPSAPRFILEDGKSVEIATLKEIPGRVRRRAIPPKPKMVSVMLQLRHSINGRYFGPGRVTVTEKQAQNFLHVEQNAAEKELSLVQQRAYIIEFHNGVPIRREVPSQRFDDILMREEVPLHSMGG